MFFELLVKLLMSLICCSMFCVFGKCVLFILSCWNGVVVVDIIGWMMWSCLRVFVIFFMVKVIWLRVFSGFWRIRGYVLLCRFGREWVKEWLVWLLGYLRCFYVRMIWLYSVLLLIGCLKVFWMGCLFKIRFWFWVVWIFWVDCVVISWSWIILERLLEFFRMIFGGCSWFCLNCWNVSGCLIGFVRILFYKLRLGRLCWLILLWVINYFIFM